MLSREQSHMVHPNADISPDARQALEALSVLSGKWQPAVLVVLADEERAGFNDLLDALPDISGKVLSDTLDTLQDSGLVERRVTSESPLRVEYRLTAAGEALRPVLEELTAWGREHIETEMPSVLVAEHDRPTTEMYSDWLSGRYAVVRAHNSEELTAALLDDVDVVLFSRRLPGVDPASVPERTPTECRTVLLVDDRPGFDVLDVGCDDVLAKPLVCETLLDAVERQLARRGEPTGERE
jgi:DNA-binding HxlR family transcriptional regulator